MGVSIGVLLALVIIAFVIIIGILSFVEWNEAIIEILSVVILGVASVFLFSRYGFCNVNTITGGQESSQSHRTDKIRGVYKNIMQPSQSYDCKQFSDSMKYKESNPDYRNLYHSITLFIDWNQVNKYVINYIRGIKLSKPVSIQNQFIESSLDKIIINKLKNKNYNSNSGVKTIETAFNKDKCAIYIMIKDNRVHIFAPFVNKNYRNDWPIKKIVFDSSDGTMQTYYKEKRSKEFVIKDMQRWWSNGSLVANSHMHIPQGVQWWYDYGFLQLRHMFDELCAHRKVSDCEFILNKRDYPIGNSFIDGRANNYTNDCIPILSFYSSDKFESINMPLIEDWELASQVSFPKTNIIENRNKDSICKPSLSNNEFEKIRVDWSKKINIAFFRGSATGKGIVPETNQRLKLINIAKSLKTVNAKLTSWNPRDKFVSTDRKGNKVKEGVRMISHIDRSQDYDIGIHNFVPMTEQLQYKYLIYVEGHSASNRYSFMMRTGSLILKVESICDAKDIWFFPLLEDYVHHVPIKSDLSDLEEKIEWCKTNDDKCKQIANNALAFYNKYITKDSVMDYLQLLCHRVSEKYQN